ncbi:MAG: DNA gyrase inhibitor YacG [Rhodomicrobium sp.]
MTDNKSSAEDTAKAPLCVICHTRPQTETYRPFCSKRCADVDLHRWLGGVYAIPGKPEEEEDEEAPGEA